MRGLKGVTTATSFDTCTGTCYNNLEIGTILQFSGGEMYAAFKAAVVFLTCASLTAQVTLSTIRGTASDPSGAVIAGADVTVVNLQTNEKRSGKTNDNGDYEIPDLYRGSYRLAAN